jgi:hypothetical protein
MTKFPSLSLIFYFHDIYIYKNKCYLFLVKEKNLQDKINKNIKIKNLQHVYVFLIKKYDI